MSHNKHNKQPASQPACSEEDGVCDGKEPMTVSHNKNHYENLPPEVPNVWLIAVGLAVILCGLYAVIISVFTNDGILKTILDLKFNSNGAIIDPGEDGIKLCFTYFATKVFQGETEVNVPAYTKVWEKISKYLFQRKIIFFLVMFIILTILFYGFIYKIILRGTKDGIAFAINSCIISGILGAMMIVCHNVTFVKIFENTFGYGLIQSFYGSFSKTIKEVAEYKSLSDLMGKLRGADAKSGIFSVKSNQSLDLFRDYQFLITLFRLDNFGDILKELKNSENDYDFKVNVPDEVDVDKPEEWSGTEDALKHMFRLCFAKHVAGFLCWIYFSALAATLIATKMLAQNK
jgi:hypothetical protein